MAGDLRGDMFEALGATSVHRTYFATLPWKSTLTQKSFFQHHSGENWLYREIQLLPEKLADSLRPSKSNAIQLCKDVPYFSHHKTHFSHTKQGGGGKSVRLMERRKQIIFSCFLPLKNRCVLWKGASYGAKNNLFNPPFSWKKDPR